MFPSNGAFAIFQLANGRGVIRSGKTDACRTFFLAGSTDLKGACRKADRNLL